MPRTAEGSRCHKTISFRSRPLCLREKAGVCAERCFIFRRTLAKCIADVYSCDEGEMIFSGRDGTFRLDAAEGRRHPLLSRKIKYVFQDPAASLDPRMTVEEILTIGVRYAKLYSRSQARDKAAFLLEAVGMAADSLKRRPADFSGGQRQRISLARALMSDPELLICDEVVSALDVSIRGQILNLLNRLKKEFGFAMLFIAHDLSVDGRGRRSRAV